VISEVPAKTVVSRDAYMLFYQRRCERNLTAREHLRSYVTAPSVDTSLTSLVNSSLDNTLCRMYFLFGQFLKLLLRE